MLGRIRFRRFSGQCTFQEVKYRGEKKKTKEEQDEIKDERKKAGSKFDGASTD